MKLCYISYDKSRKTKEYNIDFTNVTYKTYNLGSWFYMATKVTSGIHEWLDFALAMSAWGLCASGLYYYHRKRIEKEQFEVKQETEYYKLLNEFNKVSLDEEKTKLKSLENITTDKKNNIVYSKSEIQQMF